MEKKKNSGVESQQLGHLDSQTPMESWDLWQQSLWARVNAIIQKAKEKLKDLWATVRTTISAPPAPVCSGSPLLCPGHHTIWKATATPHLTICVLTLSGVYFIAPIASDDISLLLLFPLVYTKHNVILMVAEHVFILICL